MRGSACHPNRLDIMTLWELYASPVRSLLQGWQWKMPFAAVVAPVWSFLDQVESILYGLLTIPPSLIFIVGVLWLLDLISGLMKVIRTQGWSHISSIGLRQSIVKIIEYTIAIFAADLFASTGQWLGPLDVVVSQVGYMVAVLCAATEFRSIDENLKWGFMTRLRQALDMAGLLRERPVDKGDSDS